ncbi:MAG: OmpA family protein [Spirochaetes bacterium]|nr:OmpA family protein [Spirochaetota bacterium]
MKKNLILTMTFIALAFTFVIAPANAKPIYTSKEYNNLLNVKIALELELKQLKNQFATQMNNLQKEKQKLESEIDNLNKEIANLNKQIEENNASYESHVKSLENQIAILKQSGSSREKELIDENTAMQKKYEDQLLALQNTLKKERTDNTNEMRALKEKYDSKINSLEKQIAQLTIDLDYIKQLNKQQKEELERLSSQADELEKQLEAEIKAGEIRLKRYHNKLIINIDDQISFDSGSDTLKKEVMKALDKIASILQEYPEYQIIIEGHTDNIPIKSSRFADNWQLSTGRALSVLRYILKNTKLDQRRFSAAGYGEFQPIVANDTKENRALNRRVDIVVIPRIESK